MALGQFVFQLSSLPFDQVKRRSGMKWSEKNPMGGEPVLQYLNNQAKTLTLTGKIVPELTGSRDEIEVLDGMGRSGKAWVLMSGVGRVFGVYVIESIDDTSSHLTAEGHPRLTSFTITLKRYGDRAPPAMMGALKESQAT
ncbi:MAG: phage tail protein [Rhodospirillaceae bacterium]